MRSFRRRTGACLFPRDISGAGDKLVGRHNYKISLTGSVIGEPDDLIAYSNMSDIGADLLHDARKITAPVPKET